MKRPKQIIKYCHIESRPTEWVDWNGKPTRDYFIRIPYWLVRAYRLHKRSVSHPIKLIIREEFQPMTKMNKEEERSGFMKYFKANWSKKITTVVRKVTHMNMKIFQVL